MIQYCLCESLVGNSNIVLKGCVANFRFNALALGLSMKYPL